MIDRKKMTEKFLSNAAQQPDSTPFLQRPGAAKKLLIGGAITLPSLAAVGMAIALASSSGTPAPVATVQPAQTVAPVAAAPEVKEPEPVALPEPAPVEEVTPEPEPLTYSEELLAKVVSNTPGLLARETVGFIDADTMAAEIMPNICQVAEPNIVLSLDQTEVLIADSLRREQGLDKDKATNIASGLMKTALEPGVCDQVMRGDPD